MEHPINDIMRTTIEQVREMVDANTIVGEPIISGGVTLIPVSKISIGFGTGGTEIPAKSAPEKGQPFGGGGGAGIKVEPVAFLSICGETVKLLPMTVIPAETTVDRAIEALPDVVDQIVSFIEKRREEKAERKA